MNTFIRLICLLVTANVCAQQTSNHLLRALPTPGTVAIDGKLDDWDRSAGILMCYDLEHLLETNSVRAHMMYDARYLYAAFHFRDSTPLVNHVDPKHQPGSGWRSDCVQLRLWTDRILHVDCYYFTDEERPSCHIAYHDMAKRDQGFEGKIVEAIGQGVDAAFRVDPDGKGYVQEMRMEWRLLRRDGKAYRSGDSFRCGVEMFWGDPTAERWPSHRYADLINKDNPQRQFFWTANRAWGEVKLLAKGKVPREERAPSLRLAEELVAIRYSTEGPVRLDYELPTDGYVTLVVEQPDGTRVRNLMADVPRKAGKNTDYWDGADDNGRLVRPGEYRFRGLHHGLLDVRYHFAYGSPGNPPWETADGKGAWMADHTTPVDVLADDKRIYISNQMAEGGSTLIAVDYTGQKQWGIGRIWGGMLARHGQYLYMLSGGEHPMHRRAGEIWLQRFDPKTGKFASFPDRKAEHLIARYDEHRPVKPRKHDGVMVATKAYDADWLHQEALGLAAAGGKLYVSMFYEDKILVIDADKGEPVDELRLRRPAGLTADAEGNVYAISETRIVRIDAKGRATPVVTAGLEAPIGLACDGSGSIYVTDWRGAMCVKVFSPGGKLLRTIGRIGGRSLTGRYDPNGMFRPWGITVDRRGRVWVAEHDFQPKRISVWNPDGKLAMEFCGPTWYGATACNVNPHNPTQAFCMGNVLELDWDAGRWRVTGTTWRPTHPDALVGPFSEGLVFEVVEHKDRDLLVASRSHDFICLSELHDHYAKPLAALGSVHHLLGAGEMPALVAKHLYDDPKQLAWARQKYPGLFSGVTIHRHREFHKLKHERRKPAVRSQFMWTDGNGDGLVQEAEIRFYTAEEAGAVVLGSRWRFAHTSDLTLYPITTGEGRRTLAWRLPVREWNRVGAPVYDVEDAQLIVNEKPLWFVNSAWADSKGNLLLNHSPMQMFTAAGRLRWHYPNRWPGVHGSHRSPQDRRGLLIGPLKVIGSVQLAHGVGEVFCMNGNMGKAFLMTTDGLFLGSLFRDCRSAPESLPPEPTRGASLMQTTCGGEWFGGELFRNPRDGHVYIGRQGSQSQLICRVVGLETTRHITTRPIRFTPSDYAAAEKLLAERSAEEAAKTAVAILPVTKRMSGKRPPVIDGDIREWSRKREWAASIQFDTAHSAFAMLGYDEQNLYVAFDVNDSSPMRNAGKDWKLLFKTGDAVAVELGAGTRGSSMSRKLMAGDLRLLLTVMDRKPTAVLYRYVVPGTKKPEQFVSPVGTTVIDRVEILAKARVAVKRRSDGYSLEASVPLAELGLKIGPGKSLRGDLGVIHSDQQGLVNELRMYWANKATGIVSDVFSEAKIHPDLWGMLNVE